nr:transposase [Petrotoga sibirica]
MLKYKNRTIFYPNSLYRICVIGWYTFQEKANNLKFRKIDKFVNGLKRDIQAIRNAIIYEYNNGLAEGSVNKLKVIKGIMYGRS